MLLKHYAVVYFISPHKFVSVFFPTYSVVQGGKTQRLSFLMTYFLRTPQRSFWGLECTFQLAVLVCNPKKQNLQNTCNSPSTLFSFGRDNNRRWQYHTYLCELLICKQFWNMLSLLWRINTCLKHTLTLGSKLIAIVL